MKNSWKRTAAFVMAMALVAGAMPANVGGFLTGGNAIVAHAATYEGLSHEKVYLFEDTITFTGYIKATTQWGGSFNPSLEKTVYIDNQTMTVDPRLADDWDNTTGYYWGTALKNGGDNLKVYCPLKTGMTDDDIKGLRVTGAGTESDPYIFKMAYNVVSPNVTANTLTFTGSSQALVTAPTDAGIHYRYKKSTDNNYSDWSTTAPSATDAGDYDVQWYSEGDATYNASGSEENPNTLQATITVATYTYSKGTLSQDSTVYGNVNIKKGRTYNINGCVLVVNGNATLLEGSSEDENGNSQIDEDEFIPTTLNLMNNATVIINGNLTLNNYTEITAEDGCKIIVTGRVNMPTSSQYVNLPTSIYSNDASNSFYPAGVEGDIAYVPASGTSGSYYTIGDSEAHYQWDGSKFVEYVEYDLTADSGITVKNSKGNTVTGKVNSLDTYTLTSSSNFFVTMGSLTWNAEKQEDNTYKLNVSGITGNVNAYAIKTLTGSGTQSDPFIVSDKSDLMTVVNTQYNSEVYVKIDNEITLNEDITSSKYQRIRFVGSGTINGTGKLTFSGFHTLTFDGITVENELEFINSSGGVFVSSGSISSIKTNVTESNTWTVLVSGGTVGTLNCVSYHTQGEVYKIVGGTVDTIILNEGKANIVGGTVNTFTNSNRNQDVKSEVSGGTVNNLNNNGSIIVKGGTVGVLTAGGKDTLEAPMTTNTEYGSMYYSETVIVGGTINELIQKEGSYIDIMSNSFTSPTVKKLTVAELTENSAATLLRVLGAGKFGFDPTNYIEDNVIYVVTHNATDNTYTVKERELTGKGTKAEPYVISNENELLYLAEKKSGYFKVQNDANNTITLSSILRFEHELTFVGGTINYNGNGNIDAWNANFTIDGGSIVINSEYYLNDTNSGSITVKSGFVTSILNDKNVYIEGGIVDYIENNTGGYLSIGGGTVGSIKNNRDANVAIDGGNITGTLTKDNSSGDNSIIRITGGVFTNDPADYLFEGDTAPKGTDDLYHVQHNSSYQTFNETTNEWTTANLAYGSYTKVTSSDTEWTTGTYVVTKNTVLNQRVNVKGDVKLVLEDDTTLEALQGIGVNDGEGTLSIYSESFSDHTGNLYAGRSKDSNAALMPYNDDENAAIGGTTHHSQGDYHSNGEIRIYGGNITARANKGAAGIGGGRDCACGTVKIYNGDVDASVANGSYSTGIGGGYGKNGGSVYVYGGWIKSSGSESGGAATWYFNPGTVNHSDRTPVTSLNGRSAIDIDAGQTHVIDLSDCTIAAIPVQDYANGAEVKPEPVVTCTIGSTTYTLTKGVHYTVSYSNNTDYTTSAKVTVTGMGVIKGSKTVTFTIDKVLAKYKTETAAKTGLVYNGSAQALITAGTSDNGTVKYGVSNSASVQPASWSATVPAATNAGTYYVWTMIEADSSHRNNAAKLVSPDGITISEATMKIIPASKSNIVYDGAPIDVSDFEFYGDDASFVTDGLATVTITPFNSDISFNLTDAGVQSFHITIARENYETKEFDGSIIIKQRPLIFTPAENYSSVYGDAVVADADIAYTVSNAVEGDIPAELKAGVEAGQLLKVNYGTDAEAPYNAGEYSYSVDTDKVTVACEAYMGNDSEKTAYVQKLNKNYTYAVADGAKYTIEQKDISGMTVELNGGDGWTAADSHYVYDGNSKSVEVSKVSEASAATEITLNTTNDNVSGFQLRGNETNTNRDVFTIDYNHDLTLTIPEGKVATQIIINGILFSAGVSQGEQPCTCTGERTGNVSIKTLLSMTFDSGTEYRVSSVVVTYTDANGTVLTANDYEVGGDLSRRNPGEYTVEVAGKGNYKGSASAAWNITAAENVNVNIILLRNGKKDYDGKDVTDLFTVDTGAIPASKANITYAYYNAVASTESPTGWAKDGDALAAAPSAAGDYIVEVTVSGTGYKTKTMSACLTVNATAKDIEANDIVVNCPVSALNSSGWTTPKLTITDGEYTLVEGTDFTVNGGKTRKAGTYTIEIVGAGEKYSGCREVEWTVEQATAMIKSAAKYDNQGRILFTVNNSFSGTASYGVLIKRGLADGEKLTVDNAEVDYALGTANTTFVSKDKGQGVTVLPYITVDGVRYYGEQTTYTYEEACGFAGISNAAVYDNEGRILFTYNAKYTGDKNVSYGALIKRGLAEGTELTTANAEVDYAIGSANTTFVSKDKGQGVTVRPYIVVDGVRQYGEQITYSYNEIKGYAEISKAVKYDNEGRILFTYNAKYTGDKEVSYGALIKRGLAADTELTTDNAEVDYAIGSANTTFVSKDKGQGVAIRPYIVVNGERQYGEQVTYSYNDLT